MCRPNSANFCTHSLAASQPPFAEFLQRPLEPRVAGIHEIPEHVDFAAGHVATKLYAGDQAHTGDFVHGALGFGEAGGGIVVAHGDGAEALGGRQFDQLSGESVFRRKQWYGGGGQR